MSSLLLFPPPPVQPPSDELPDRAAREQALDTSRSFFVEAPAGSGKTGLLIQRYLRLLADPSVTDPSQILAITFTTKATAEMRERVVAQLAAAERGDEPTSAFDGETRVLAEAALARSSSLGWQLLDDPQIFAIQTIDAVCAEIVRSLPVLTGGNLSASIPEPAGLYQEAARNTLRQLGGPDPRLSHALHQLLLHRDGDLGNCERLLATMLAWRDQWTGLLPQDAGGLDDVHLDATVRPRLEANLDQAICRTLTQLNRILPEHLAHQLAQFARRMSDAEGYKGQPSPTAICRNLHTAPGRAASDLAHWKVLAGLVIAPSQNDWRRGFNVMQLGHRTSDSDKEELATLIKELSQAPGACEALCGLANLPPATYPDDQWRMVKHLLRILWHTLGELRDVFANTGKCDFTEVSLLAATALRHAEAEQGLLAIRGSRLQHLLVDEMQDTSNNQYALLESLTRGWNRSGRTVFLVGDPKQSIYIFRQARVERFVRALLERRFGDIQLTTLALSANFRSQAGLVGALNTSFRAIFPAAANPSQPEEVPFVEAAAVRPAQETGNLTWHAHVLPSLSTEESSAARVELAAQDAATIRRLVLAWRARPLPPGRTKPWTIAVLVRARQHLTEIIAALKGTSSESSIPFRAIEIEPLGDRQEILDLVALVRALLHPADRVAWFAVLRAPWCGLTLADLHQLAGADDDSFARYAVPRLIEERGHELSEDGCARLARVWPVLTAAQARRRDTGLTGNLHRTWRALGAEAAATSDEKVNISRFFRLLQELEEPGGKLDLTTLTQRLTRLYAEEAQEAGAIDLLTIHRAKGLEWDVVFVPALERLPRAREYRLVTWLEVEAEDEQDANGILAPISAKGEKNQDLISWMRSVATARDRAEQKRMVYVACTRAREEVHLFGTATRSAKGTLNAPPSSLLAALWPAVREHFERSAPYQPRAATELLALAAAASSSISRAFPLLRIPGLLPPAEPPSVPMPVPFARPEGSFAARSFGNVTHALLETLTKRAEDGASRESLLAELPRWKTRAHALLRGTGLSPAPLERYAERIVNALISTVQDEYGWWLLRPPGGGAISEGSVVSPQDDTFRTIRIDRMFHAGPDPLSTGDDFLWIVDYKTGSHGTGSLDDFLARQRNQYAPQLESYATALSQTNSPVRLALYYPLLSRLVWWQR